MGVCRNLRIVILVLIIAMSVSACKSNCKKPFFEYEKNKCCLDSDNDKKCDDLGSVNNSVDLSDDASNSTEGQIKLRDIVVGIENNGETKFSGFSFDMVIYGKLTEKGEGCKNTKIRLSSETFSYDDVLNPKEQTQKTITVNAISEVPNSIMPKDCAGKCACESEIVYEMENLKGK